MSAAALPLRPNFYKQPTDLLIQARELLNGILDDRARQASLFDDRPTVIPQKVYPVSSCVPDVLSPSSVNVFSECEAKWFYRKVLQLPEKRGAALGIGSAVHDTLAANFRQKIETKEDLPFDGLRVVFRDEIEKQLDTVTLEPCDDAQDIRECGETLVRVYLEQAAPSIQPAAVELPVEGIIGGVAVHGFVDLLDVNGDIIDIKTAAKKPSGFPAGHRLQVTTYSMLTPNASGRARLDTVTKTKTVSLHSQTIDVSAADRKHAEKFYAITLDQMRSGLVKPNRNSFMCSRKHCGYWETCVADYGGSVD